MIKKEEITLKNIYAFIEGYLRYTFWVNKKVRKIFIRKHIEEQIEYRLNSIRKECYQNGACVICGCDIPPLLMASKTCGGLCYPTLKSKKEWKRILTKRKVKIIKNNKKYYYIKYKLWFIDTINKKFIKIKRNELGKRTYRN